MPLIYLTTGLLSQSVIPSVVAINRSTQRFGGRHRGQILQRRRCCRCVHLVRRRGESERLSAHLKRQITSNNSPLQTPAVSHGSGSRLRIRPASLLSVFSTRNPCFETFAPLMHRVPPQRRIAASCCCSFGSLLLLRMCGMLGVEREREGGGERESINVTV